MDQGGEDLSPKQAAKVVGCHPKTVERMCRRREIGYKVGRVWRISHVELARLRRLLTEQGAA